MPAFLIIACISTLGCLGFAFGLQVSLGDGGSLTVLARVVLGLLAIAATNGAIWYACRRLEFDLRRPLGTVNALFVALLLLFLQNKAMVGQQEIQADLGQPDGRTYQIAFRDLAGVPVNAENAEQRALSERLKGDEYRDDIAIVGAPEVTPEHRLKITLAPDTSVEAFRDRVIGKPFHRTNAERDLFAVNMGIDLRGGVEFICQLYNDLGQRVPADDEVLHTLRSRLDQRGLTEPTATRLSNGDVQIVIPGGTPADAARTRSVIEQTGRLEFREVLKIYAGPTWTVDAQGQRQLQLPPEVVRNAAGIYEFAPGVRGTRKELLAVDKTRDPTALPQRFLHLGPAELTGKHVESAERTLDQGHDAVSITFTSTGGALNGDFTTRLYNDRTQHIGAQGRNPETGQQYGVLGILFDGKVVSAPIVQEPSNNHCLINGIFTPEQIDTLKAALRGGSLAVTPVVLSERVVGATLGIETVSRAVTTMLWTFAGILLFMAFYYRRLGMVAVLCLLITTALTWSSLSIFGATITLPGLAGLMLSVAMSIDTNVLVFERIREELRAGKDVRTAVDLGYNRAFLAILDSNLTTILSGLILYWVGSGSVKGFGLTLAVGVAVSMFSGVYIARMITELFTRGLDTLRFSAAIGQPRLPFVGWRRVSYAVSILTGVLGIGYFAFGHLLHHSTFDRNFDIDFTGGNLVQVTFQQPQSADAVHKALEQAWAADATANDLLDPAELATPQAYFASLGGDRSASRQWVFRGRDETGANLEAQRADRESERGSLQRQIDRARDPEKPDEAKARELEPQVRKLSDEIRAFETQIAERVDVFKRQISGAFPGMVAPEGAELSGAAWKERTLSLTLATLGTPEASQVAHLRERLARRAELAAVEVSPTNEAIVVAVTWREAPAKSLLPVDDALARRLSALLADSAGTQVGDVSNAAHDLVQDVIQAAATVGITVAQPYPASQHFSGQVAGAMKRSALIALVLASLGMLAYIAARFEMGFGIAAIVALVHDLLLTVGLVVLFGLRIDLTVIAALLTIIGYSVNDTIVNFDRIRENLKLMSGKSLAEIIDVSVAQTIPRTLLTGGATILAMIAMMLCAGHEVFAFNATLLIGTILGTYSSVFVAAPMLLLFDRSKLETPAPPPEAHVETEGEAPVTTA